MVPTGTESRGKTVAAKSANTRQEGIEELAVRQRILEAAFSAFMEGGYAATSTLQIASRARVSKRALYALVGNKQQMLAACIGERAKRLQLPTDLPAPSDRESLAQVLTAFGTKLLREISDPTVIAVFRLAIAEAIAAPEIAQTLDAVAYQPIRAALQGIMARAQSSRLLAGEPDEMAEHFSGLLWGNLLPRLLLRIAEQPSPREIARRASHATAAFLKLHPQPDPAETPSRSART
jgi:AcrR family transcriptional regulator